MSLFATDFVQFKVEVKKMELNSFRGFQFVAVEFDPELTVFIAGNGGGKTTLLDAVYETIQELAIHAFNYPNSHSTLSSKDVKVGQYAALLSVEFKLAYQILEKQANDHNEEDQSDSSIGHNEENESDNSIDHNEEDQFDSSIGHNEENESDNSIDHNEEDGSGSSFIIQEHPNTQILVKTSINSKIGLEDVEFGEPEDQFEISVLSNYFQQYLRPEIDNRPVLKYYKPGEMAKTEADKNFETFFKWIDRRQKVGYQKNNAIAKKHLDWLTESVAYFLSDEHYDYTNLSIDYNLENERLCITKRNKSDNEESILDIRQLSSGERVLLGIVTDLAIALIDNNPSYGEGSPLTVGFGIVLIDEIDVHLHPAWQMSVLPKFKKLFPNVQLIATTHSPLVLGNIGSKHIKTLENGEIYDVLDTYAREASDILETTMDVEPGKISYKIDQISKLITLDSKDEAEEQINLLIKEINASGDHGENHPDIIKLKSLITRKRIIGK